MNGLAKALHQSAIPLSPINPNPYGRLPVCDPNMLFGRRRELAQIQALLSSGAALIILRGQNRIGKTSLLLHLRDYRLDPLRFYPIFVDFQSFSRTDSAGLFYEIAQAIYHDLRTGGRMGDGSVEPSRRVCAPPLAAFEQDAANQLAIYLYHVQRILRRRLVLLLDEFSMAIDAYQQELLEARFFCQWQGLVQRVGAVASFIAAVQQVSFDRLRKDHGQNPVRQLLEISTPVILHPLSAKEIADLAERPMRNHLSFTREALARVGQLTGGSPFLAQVFCYALTKVGDRQQRQITLDDVETVRHLFLSPDENLFIHLLDLVRGPADPVVRRLVHLTGFEGACVPVAALQQALPNLKARQLQQILADLVANDIVVYCADGDSIRFASLLFAHWLLVNDEMGSRTKPHAVSPVSSACKEGRSPHCDYMDTGSTLCPCPS